LTLAAVAQCCGQPDRYEIRRVNPFVGEGDSARRDDLVPERDRPEVLDEDHRGAAAGRDRVLQVPDLRLVDDVAVLAASAPTIAPASCAFLATHPQADESADDRAEFHRLVRVQVRRLEDVELTVVGLRHEEEVDEADQAGVL
jgi:hypothetical protein